VPRRHAAGTSIYPGIFGICALTVETRRLRKSNDPPVFKQRRGPIQIASRIDAQVTILDEDFDSAPHARVLRRSAVGGDRPPGGRALDQEIQIHFAPLHADRAPTLRT
jgi:hypothetical protein